MSPHLDQAQNDNFIQPLGRALVLTLYAASQSLRFYPMENATVQKSLDELHRIIRRLLDREGMLDLRIVGDFMFVNDARLRLHLSDYAAFSYALGVFHRHEIGRVEFGAELKLEDIAPFISLLLQDAPEEDAFDRFQRRLSASLTTKITVEPSRGTAPLDDPNELNRAKEVAKMTYFQSVHVAREVLTDTRLGRAVNLRRVKRAVQSIVDQVLNNETSMLGMTTLRDYDEYTFTHSVNVCIISVIIGQKLGLTKTQLFELGLGALFHDIGKQRIDQEVLQKPSGLDEHEWEQMRRHPTEGMLALFGMRGIAEMPYRAMLMAYEHHMKIDLTGYPKNHRHRRPTLFSRIVAIADGFDAATSKRSYQQQPWGPEEVLREMRDNPDRGYDRLLVKALISTTGIFPVGTLAILDTFELAVVVARNADSRKLHQPVVKIVSDANGFMLSEPFQVNLSEVEAATGATKRTIVKTTDPEQYGIRVSDYFA
jgi:HD-GYP domain-containing protein (c-di-GMP phosphodiesterase class II)